jgi:xylose isomerase
MIRSILENAFPERAYFTPRGQLMNITDDKLAKLAEYSGYLEGEKLDAFMDEFEIPFGAGHWCAGDFADRFNPSGYNSNNPDFEAGTLAEIKRIAQAKIKGIEFHDVAFFKGGSTFGGGGSGEVDENQIETIKQALAEYSLVPINMNINVWSDPKWQFGGITNPDAGVRRAALDQCLQAAEIGRKVGCRSLQLWPGSDGWDYNFEVNYGRQLDWFIEGCIAIDKKAAQEGLIFGTEAKHKEPREGNMILYNTAKAAAVAQEVNKASGTQNMGVVIDYGHEQMVGTEPADNLYFLKRIGVPIRNFHINSSKYKSNDEDRIPGSDDVWRFADFLYAAIDTNYDGWFGLDQFTYRMEQVKALELSRELFANHMKKALMIYARRDQLEAARATGRSEATIDVVKKILLNG